MVRDYILSAVRKNSAAQVLLVQYQGTTPTCARKLIRLFPCLGHAASQGAFYSVPHALSAPGRDKCGRFPSAITGRHTGRFGQGTQRWQSRLIQGSNKAGTKQFPQGNELLHQLLVVLVAASCGYTKERGTEKHFWVLGYPRLFVELLDFLCHARGQTAGQFARTVRVETLTESFFVELSGQLNGHGESRMARSSSNDVS